ncbi:MAG: DUF494 family protein [Bacteroidota bacterium]
MFEKIVEILIYILTQIREKNSLSDIDVSQLEKDGYTTTEISATFSWLIEKMHLNEEIVVTPSTLTPESHRAFHEIEKLAIDTEARGYLVQLRELGLINDLELEYIIERIMLGDYSHANVDDIKVIVSSIFFEMKDAVLWGARNSFIQGGTVH